jgi:hypothetical protein
MKNATYDVLLYVPIEIALENDGRSMDVGFQKAIDEQYLQFLIDNDLDFSVVKGSVEDRVQMAKDVIEKHTTHSSRA